MARPSNRDKILSAGLKVVHERGFAGASVRDIVQAAGVPQGSFTNHFTSKESFGLEILDLYFANGLNNMSVTLRNQALSPLERLRSYVQLTKERATSTGEFRGCLYGNFAAEACNDSESIRHRLVEIFDEIRSTIAANLHEAVAKGEARPDLDCEEMAGFFLSSMQGALLLSKAYRDKAPIERSERMLFGLIEAPAG